MRRMLLPFFFNFQLYPFLFGNSFSTHQTKDSEKKNCDFLVVTIFFQFCCFFLFLVVKFELKHIEKHMYAAQSKQSPLYSSFSCFIPNSFSFFLVFMVFSLLNRCLFSLFLLFMISHSLYQTYWWCLPCFQFVLRPYWLAGCLLVKKPYKRICVDTTPYTILCIHTAHRVCL